MGGEIQEAVNICKEKYRSKTQGLPLGKGQ